MTPLWFLQTLLGHEFEGRTKHGIRSWYLFAPCHNFLPKEFEGSLKPSWVFLSGLTKQLFPQDFDSGTEET